MKRLHDNRSDRRGGRRVNLERWQRQRLNRPQILAIALDARVEEEGKVSDRRPRTAVAVRLNWSSGLVRGLDR